MIEEDESLSDGPLLRALTFFGAALLGAAVFLMAGQVILRFAFNAPQAWAEEIDRYLFIWMVYVGSLVALMRGTHIRVTFFIERFGRRGEVISRILTGSVGLFSFGVTAYYGYRLAWSNRTGSFYTLDFMPLALLYLSVPICMTGMVLILTTDLWRGIAMARNRS